MSDRNIDQEILDGTTILFHPKVDNTSRCQIF